MIPGLKPESLRNPANQIINGVLPVPPTVILPTTITGTGSVCVFSTPRRYKNFLNLAASLNKKPNGISHTPINGSLYQISVAHRVSVFFIAWSLDVEPQR